MSLTLPQGLRHRLRSGHARHALSRRVGRGDAGAAKPVARLLRRARPQRHDDACSRARRASRSRTRPAAAPCRGCGFTARSSTRCRSRRRPFLTATRLLSNQTFRDLYRSGTFDPEQRFKITSLTILFTDLRGSTALYDRVGDLAAFDLVRSHFGELIAAVAAEGGAVVKTIGDAVMATFPTPDRALRAAMRMREAMRKINERARQRGSRPQHRPARGPVPGGDARRPAGLFRPDRQHRRARAGPRRAERDPGDEADRRERRGRAPRRRGGIPHDVAAPVAARGERSVRDLRGPRTR